MNTTESRREFEEWARDKMIPEMAMKYAQAAWQAARERQWMPIESAPKDGTQILSFAEWEGITVCSWLECSEIWEEKNKYGWVKYYDTNQMSYEVFQPTHWMPLHNPPTSEKI